MEYKTLPTRELARHNKARKTLIFFCLKELNLHKLELRKIEEELEKRTGKKQAQASV